MAASPFRSAIDLMAQYASYHRDRRNIATHFVGIPLIVFAIGILLARAELSLGGVSLTAAWLLWGLSTVWYLTRGNLVLGLAVSLVNGVLMALARANGRRQPEQLVDLGHWQLCLGLGDSVHRPLLRGQEAGLCG